MEEKIVRKFYHRGRELGEIVEYPQEVINSETGRINQGFHREFRPNIGEIEAIDLLRDMKLEDKIHMKHSAYGVYRLLQHYHINPDDYLENEDIMIYIADKGFKSLTDLYRGDHRSWELVKQRGLETELFSAFEEEK